MGKSWAFRPLLGAQDLILLQELLHEAFQVLQGNHGELKEMSKMEHFLMFLVVYLAL
jgi:hypothetical protein